MQVRYLDNAASSWPKPEQVAKAVATTIADCGANPGRGSHRMAVEASRILFETRKQLSQLVGVRNPNDICFTWNTTDALNMAILGFLGEGDHVICTSVEHNSVRRPLEYLHKYKGVGLSYLESNRYGEIDLAQAEKSFHRNTKLLVVNHSSNLLGNILPIEAFAEMAQKHDCKLLVDAAQTMGSFPIHIEDMRLDMVAFPGHKGLLGPQGTGGLYIHPDIELQPLRWGGTGSQSELIEQPHVRPDRYEAGTLNTPGIAGLHEGVAFIRNETVQKIQDRERQLTQTLMEGFQKLNGLTILGPELGIPRTSIVSIHVEGIDCSELAFILDTHYQIAVRAGYHCTPLAHQTAGTLERGAVRFSPGYFNTMDDIDACIQAVAEIMKQMHG